MILDVTGSGMAPANAGAVVLTITAMGGTASGSLIAYPAGITPPNTSTLSWRPGEAVSNLATIKVGSGGRVSLANLAGSVDVVVDLNGYYAPPNGPTGAGRYFPVPPFRLLDSRETYPVGPGPSQPIKVAGTAVPPAAEAAVLNVTAVNPTENGFLTVAAGVLQCSSRALNPPCVATWNLPLTSGKTVSTRVITPLGKGPDGTPGWISFFSPAGWTNLLVDVQGWYGDSTIPATMGSTFTPIDLCRALDQGFVPVGPQPVQLAGVCRIPTGSTAVVMNVTLDRPTASGDLAIEPSHLSTESHIGQAFASCSRFESVTVSLGSAVDLVWASGQTVANLSQAVLSPTGTVDIGIGYPAGRLLFDVSGYFSPASAHTHVVCMFAQARDWHPPSSGYAAATVFDMATNQPVSGLDLTFTTSPMPGGGSCPGSSLDSSTHRTDSIGSAVAEYKPVGASVCLITARERSGASGSISAVFGILSLAPATKGLTVHVDATYLRADGTPHTDAAIDFNAIVNSMSGGPIASGRCLTDRSGQCGFSYKLGVYTGATIIFAHDAAGLQVYTSAQGTA
jgi:hypothetical protein